MFIRIANNCTSPHHHSIPELSCVCITARFGDSEWVVSAAEGPDFHIADNGFTSLQHDWSISDQYIGSGNPAHVRLCDFHFLQLSMLFVALARPHFTSLFYIWNSGRACRTTCFCVVCASMAMATGPHCRLMPPSVSCLTGVLRSAQTVSFLEYCF